jgi:hypothetical protein
LQGFLFCCEVNDILNFTRNKSKIWIKEIYTNRRITHMWAAVGGLAVVGVFAAVVYYLAKKDGQKDEERIRNLTEEQKKILLETPYLEAPGFPNGVLAHGLIYEIPKMTGSKVELVVMLNARYYPNSKGLAHADIKMSLKEFQRQGLKVGDYVKVLLNEDKSPKIVF